MNILPPFIWGAVVLLAATPVHSFDLRSYRAVDLSHSYDSQTLYWPSRPPMSFELQKLAFGVTAGGWFYAANRLCTPEHGGTHLDAPIHFYEHGQTTEQLPLEKLLAPGVRIDVTRQAQASRNYRLSREDVLQFEARAGRIHPGTIVLLHTGWSRYKNAMEWVHAWIGHKTPAKGEIGFMYMLSGGTDASNTDPYAKKPEPGNHWIETGPHVMIVGAEPSFYDLYPKSADPDTSAPYVMWPGTAYQHLMIPIK